MKAEDIDGYMTSEELEALRREACIAYVVVEIGCWHGRSTYALAEVCPGVVYAVDWFRGTPSDAQQTARVREAATNGEGERAKQAFLSNLKDFLDQRKVFLLTMESTEAALRMSMTGNPFIDLLFIDGSHDTPSVTRDLDAWLPLLRPGGVLLLHDRDYLSIQEAVRLKQIGPMIYLAGSLWKWIKASTSTTSAPVS